MGAHALLMPSAAHRWVVCALSVSAEAAAPHEEDSPESREGTAAHSLVQLMIQHHAQALNWSQYVGAPLPDGTPITQEMVEGGEMTLDALRKRGLDLSSLRVEQRVSMGRRIHPQNWGTPDYRAWSRLPDGRLKLSIFDYKFGHRIVEVFENWQLVDYVAGCVEEARLDGLEEQNTVVEMTIIQPRAPHRQGPVRSWTVKASDLRGQWNVLEMAAEAAMGPDPKATPTAEGCRDCRARLTCEAFQREAWRMRAVAQQSLPIEMSPLALGLELRALSEGKRLLDARVEGLKAQAEAMIRKGQHVPYWGLEASAGRTAWTIDKATIKALGDSVGVNLFDDPTPVTPRQAALAIKAKLGATVTQEQAHAFVAPYCSKSSGSMQLVPDDGTKARLTFGSSNT